MGTPKSVAAIPIALWLAVSTWAAKPSDAEVVRVQLVTGGHSHEISFYDAFQGNTDFVIDVNPHPGAFHSDMRKSVDVLVLYDMAGWYEEVVGGRYLLQAEGNQPASSYVHDLKLKIRPVRQHPITDGIGEFEILDEVYNKIWRSPKSRVLLEADRPEGEKAVAWIGPWQKSRVVVIQLGHGREAHESPYFRRLLRYAILCASGRMPDSKECCRITGSGSMRVENGCSAAGPLSNRLTRDWPDNIVVANTLGEVLE